MTATHVAPLTELLLAFETGKRPKGGAVEVGVPSLGGEHVTATGELKLAPMKFVPEHFYAGMLKGHLSIGDILVVKDGATTGRVGMVEDNFPFERAGVNEHLFLLRANQNVVGSKYLFFYLRSHRGQAEIMSDFRGAAQGGISREIGSKVRVPLRPFEEQDRIVDLLSRAEGIVRLRREAQDKTAELVPALFLDMFGDPASNPKGWPSTDFGTLGQLDRGKSRHRPRDAQELYDGPYPFIQTGDVTNSGGHITRYTQTYSELGLAQSRLWPAGTLCITIAANIARTGVLDFDACFPDSVVGFTPSQDVTIEYIQHWLGFLQPTLERNAPQAAQKNINLEILRNLPVPVPPIELQRQFAAKADAVRGIAAQQAAALATAQATFDALLHQSFQH